jgi:hypothetical protein
VNTVDQYYPDEGVGPEIHAWIGVERVEARVLGERGYGNAAVTTDYGFGRRLA